MDIKLNEQYLKGFLDDQAVQGAQKEFQDAFNTLKDGSGKGNDYLGWLKLPSSIKDEDLDNIGQVAEKIRFLSDAVIVIGIGGSYLGARAVIEGIQGPWGTALNNPKIYFAGNNISSDYLSDLINVVREKKVSLIVISKSGTTTEPAIAFRILKKEMEKRYGDVRERIIAVTDAKKGALRTLADQEGYLSFVIPDDVGGRFSVLTPVGLLPIAVAGLDIHALVKGARQVEEETQNDPSPDCALNRYVLIRNLLYRQGKKVEIMANFEPALHYVTEWWKQLYGESEGKDQKGIFPAGVDLTTDLHSMGQWIQDGERYISETFLIVEKNRVQIVLEEEENDLDGLNYLAGKDLNFVNRKAYEGTALAHFHGGVPSLTIEIPELNESVLGQLIFFFEKACGLSGYLLGVNPFNQPGVEEYKKNMFQLLGKPGY